MHFTLWLSHSKLNRSIQILYCYRKSIDDFEEKKNKAKRKNDVVDHLIKKMVLKALIFLSMVYTISSDLTDRVRHFETLTSSDLSHKIVKRGLDPNGIHKFNKIREVGFKTLGREFRLILSPKKGLLHPNFKVKSKSILLKKAF